ncbi:restriction endonuclease subunit S [Flavobacterium sp. XS2P12]|uniref:restriction endonuclease subunit S n=1 Tax=Flavobacterium melibiosi TaxID=3398734 RepID=UPI003A8962A5
MQEKYKSMSNVPNLRFPEFKGEWEVKKLGEVAEINPSNKSLPIKFIYIDLESVVNGELIKENEILQSEAPSRAQRILKEDDVLFQMVRPYQMNNLFFNKNGNYVASTGYAQIRTMQNSIFVFQYLHYQKFVDKVIERCTGTSYPAINSTDLSNIRISFPTLPEQQKIANFLSLIDEQIQTQNKIIENLKTLIKGTSEKLFTQKLRFKDDNGSDFLDWEVKKLGEIANRITNKNKENNLNVLTISAQFGLISQLEFFNKSVSAKDVTGYYLLNKNDFAYNKSYSNGYPMGAIKRLSRYKKGVVSTLYICFRFNDSINFKFMAHYFETGFQNSEIEKVAQEGARNHGLLNIGVSDFFNINLNLPSLPEQNQIANFLSQIDEKIETEKKLLVQYEDQKKYFLQNLFI